MTPEEKAVIEAAETWADNRYEDNAIVALLDAVNALTISQQPWLASEWLPATLADSLAGDRIRMHGEETTVTHVRTGIWNATPDGRKPWQHLKLELDLEANPGWHEYPPNLECEILCTPERVAMLEFQRQFPGTAPVTVNCPHCSATSQNLPAHLADYHPEAAS